MGLFLPVFTALWLGILTSISPCPLATNIAAMSFVSYRVARKGNALLSGILYTLGRSIVYVAISFLVVKAMVNIPILSNFLQKYLNKILGILLILVGMYLLELVKFNLPSLSPSEKMQKKLDNAGVAGAFVLGGVFALAFCPVSAALFFGSLIPLAIKSKSSIVLPLFYGIGTAVPVLIFAVLVAIGSTYLNKIYQKVTKIEFWTKRVTGVIFILAGIYYVLVYIFGVF
jgi:cytochrome c biogenesis protein CcdA